MRFSALLFKNERTESKAPSVKDVKSNHKESITFIDKSKVDMPTYTSKASTKAGLKEKMRSYFLDMRRSGVPKSERRTSVAYALAFLRTNIALEDDEQSTSMDFDDTEETEVAIAANGSIPVVTSDPENDQRTTVVATASFGRNVNISWTRPADSSSFSSSSLITGDSKASSVSNGENEDQESLDPITYTNGASIHTIHVRNGIRFHHTTRSPLPDRNSSGQPGPPFNHFPQELRPRPRGLRRENAFCHKSHYEIFWYPGFGDYNKPPMTVEEALPAHYLRPLHQWAPTSAAASSSTEQFSTSSGDEITTTAIPSTVPVNISTSPSVSRKRARDNDNSDGAPPHRRPRSV
ncbi:hypothetical protein E4T56_gene3479 [Termitomyces sp. T112]|nr:hypothetical protein E4T56_gene3479 [Termitomyces sp. T112]